MYSISGQRTFIHRLTVHSSAVKTAVSFVQKLRKFYRLAAKVWRQGFCSSLAVKFSRRLPVQCNISRASGQRTRLTIVLVDFLYRFSPKRVEKHGKYGHKLTYALA
jgi:hypothetical protein